MDAVKADLVAHLATLYAPPFGEVHHDKDAVWFITGDPDPHRNGILDTAVQPDQPHEQINRLLGPFRTRQQSMMWWFFTSVDGLDDRIHEALIAQHLYLESDRPSMEVDLTHQLQSDERSDLHVQRIQDERGFKPWVEVVADAFGSPADHSSLSTRAFRNHGFAEDAPFHHYISSLDDGTVVGAATLSLAGGVAGLGNIATLRAFQRQGVAFATVRHVLRNAARRGLRIAALSADPAGTALYLKLGFRITGKHLTYIWNP